MSAPRGLQKIIIIGAQGVGKTSLMERFVAQKFQSQYKATIGADFSTRDVTVDGHTVTLQIWDTAGQERYQSLGNAFYRGADACVLVYDVTDAQSFTKLESWRSIFLQAADVSEPATFPFVVLGNKADMDKHVVTPAAVSAWCGKNGAIPAFLVSAKTGDNVEASFLSLVKAAAARVKEEAPIIPEALKLDAAPKQSAGGCAC